jgi:outer membrane protein assembly factor BamB
MVKHLLITFILICGYYHSISDPIQNPKTKWKFKTQGSIRGTAVAQGNQIYFGSADGFFYALNKSSGELLWKYQTQGAISATPALMASMVIFTSRDNFVYALNSKTGQLIWRYQMQPIMAGYWEWEYFTATPVISDDRVYVGAGDGHLYALSIKEGKQIWKFRTNGRVRATPLVVGNTIYQPSNDGMVYVLNSNGKLLWQFETDGSKIDSYKVGFDRTNIFAKPLLADSLLIIASRDGKTYGIDIYTHKEKWRFTYGSTWAMSTSVEEQTVFVGWSTNNLLCALDLKTGKEKWKFKSDGVVYTTPLVLDDVVVVGSGDEKVYSINKKSGQKIWEYKVGGKVNSSVISDSSMH